MSDRTPAEINRHREMLFYSLFAIIAAPLLQVLPDERVSMWAVPSVVLPPSCPSREFFGVECPGCGMTRSFVHLAHGDWRASFETHRVGWLLMLAAALQIPYRAHMIWGSGRLGVGKNLARIISGVIITLLFGNWFLKMFGI